MRKDSLYILHTLRSQKEIHSFIPTKRMLSDFMPERIRALQKKLMPGKCRPFGIMSLMQRAKKKRFTCRTVQGWLASDLCCAFRMVLETYS